MSLSHEDVIKQAIATMDNEDTTPELFDLAAWSFYVALNSAQREVLKQLLFLGPIWDGDICSKAARDTLFKLGLVVRCCFKGEQGFTAATYRAYSIHTRGAEFYDKGSKTVRPTVQEELESVLGRGECVITDAPAQRYSTEVPISNLSTQVALKPNAATHMLYSTFEFNHSVGAVRLEYVAAPPQRQSSQKTPTSARLLLWVGGCIAWEGDVKYNDGLIKEQGTVKKEHKS